MTSPIARYIVLPGALILTACGGLLLGSLDSGDKQATADQQLAAQVFEMRTYKTAPGRLEVLHTRFRNHTNWLFVKHGMQLIGYWTPMDKEGKRSEDTLVYILAYPSLEARAASWKAFMNDPDWQKAWADSKKDGPVVVNVEQQFLRPTNFSPIR